MIEPTFHRVFGVSEDIIDWDIISLLAGVEDERGTLLQEVDINDEPSD